MSKIVTKEDLLREMARLHACEDATTWVMAQEGTADEIWLRCSDVRWLVWFVSMQNTPAIAAFARRCAERTKGYAYATTYAHYAKCAADYAEAAAAAYDICYYDVVNATYYAAGGNLCHGAEISTQLAELHTMLPSSK